MGAPDWASPHFAIIIKLLADQSLVGIAGVLEQKKRKQTPLAPTAISAQDSPLHPPSSPFLSPPPNTWRTQTLEQKGPGLPRPLHQLCDLDGPLNLYEPQSP